MRIREAAYWASWADALPLIQERFPQVWHRLSALFEDLDAVVHAACPGPRIAPPGLDAVLLPEEAPDPPYAARDSAGVPFSVQAVHESSRALATAGFQCPSWAELAEGARPGSEIPGAEDEGDAEPSAKGWQRFAARAVESEAAEQLRGHLHPSLRARLRSQGGPGAGMWLLACPTDPALMFEPELFLVALRMRLLLPLPLGESRCRCGVLLDAWGIHLLACQQTGRITRRARIHDDAIAQILREAGAQVRPRNRSFLRDLAIPGVRAEDARRLDVVAAGLPLYGGRTIVVDATLRSPLTGSGMWRYNGHDEDGASFAQAIRDKHHKYPELLSQGLRVHFVVAAAEVGGRACEALIDLVRQAARHKATQFAPKLRGSMQTVLTRRFWGILSVATQRAVAQCASEHFDINRAAQFPVPDLESLLSHPEAPDVSRLP